MSNIFKSKEVYKRLKKKTEEDKVEIVPVYGVYVSGEHRPPEYTNPAISITNIIGKKCYVENYITTYSETYSDSCNVAPSVMSWTKISVTRYTQSRQETYSDSCNVAPSEMTFSKMTVNRYTRSYQEAYSDSCNVAPSAMSFGDMSVGYLYSKTYHTIPEPIIRINALSTTSASVNNVIE